MATNWLQNLLITNNELLDPVLFLRSVVLTHIAYWSGVSVFMYIEFKAIFFIVEKMLAICSTFSVNQIMHVRVDLLVQWDRAASNLAKFI